MSCLVSRSISNLRVVYALARRQQDTSRYSFKPNLSVCPVLSCPVLSYPILSYPIPSHPIPSHPIPSHPIPSHPILSYPIPISSTTTTTIMIIIIIIIMGETTQGRNNSRAKQLTGETTHLIRAKRPTLKTRVKRLRAKRPGEMTHGRNDPD